MPGSENRPCCHVPSAESSETEAAGIAGGAAGAAGVMYMGPATVGDRGSETADMYMGATSAVGEEPV